MLATARRVQPDVDLAIWLTNNDYAERVEIPPLLRIDYRHDRTWVMMMSKKVMLERLEAQLEDLPPELFVALGDLAHAGREIWFNKHDLKLDKDARAERNEPLATVGATTIVVEIQGKRFTVTQDDPDKPSVVIPVGMTDKITTSMTNKDWIIGFLYASLGACFNGDFTHADNLADFINECLDDAKVEDEDGRTRIDKDRLPTFVNAVEVAEFIDSLKRQHVTHSRGTTRSNLTVAVEDIQAVPAVTTLPSPASVVVADPMSVSAEPSNAIVTTIDAPEEGGVESSDGTAPPDPQLKREQIENALITVIGSEARTIGFVRKTMEGFDEADWRPRLESMLKTGRVTKEGKARSTRYSLTEVVE